MKVIADDQFRETFGETQDRWRAIKMKRRAEGRCWQCAKLIPECTCPNVNHAVVGGSVGKPR